MKTRAYIAFLLVFLAFSGFGQSRKLKNQPKYDTKKIHFGFSTGLNYYDFRIETIENLSDLTGYYSVKSVTEPGYTISIISNLRLGHHLDLRFYPGYASTVRKLHFDVLNQYSGLRETEIRDIASSFIEFPFDLKFKSQRINNYRAYTTVGIKYALDLASDEKVEDDRVFKLINDDYSYTIGVGWDFYFEFFKFSTELRGIWGFNNLKVEDGTFLVEGIDKIKTRGILINLTFE